LVILYEAYHDARSLEHYNSWTSRAVILEYTRMQLTLKPKRLKGHAGISAVQGTTFIITARGQQIKDQPQLYLKIQLAPRSKHNTSPLYARQAMLV
jgi:hypothetical protein